MCNSCGRADHFSKVCKRKRLQFPPNIKYSAYKAKGKKPIHPLQLASSSGAESSDAEGYLYTVATSRTPKAVITVCGYTFPITVDTGSSLNVLDQNTFSKLKGVALEKAKIKAFAYNTDEPVGFAGKFEALIETQKHYTTSTFYVTKGNSGGCLLSAESAQDLKLISFHLSTVSTSDARKIQPVNIDTKDQAIKEIVNSHSNVFAGIGTFKKPSDKTEY